jgi:hypothetical protein
LQEALGFQIPEPDDLEVVEDYVPGPLREMDRARAVTVLKRADWIPPAIGSTNVILPGKMFYRFDDGPLSPLTAGMIDDFWDAKYGAPFVRVRGPEWRSNCGDYATGTEGHSLGDVPQVWGFLNGKPIGDKHDVKGKNLETISLLLTSLADGTYVFAYASHFVRMAVAGPNVRVSQKDADSGVYSTNMNRQQAAAYVAARSDVLSSAGVFKI